MLVSCGVLFHLGKPAGEGSAVLFVNRRTRGPGLNRALGFDRQCRTIRSRTGSVLVAVSLTVRCRSVPTGGDDRTGFDYVR